MAGNIVGLKELRGNVERYIAEVKKGKSFTVVRRSKPIFRLSPVDTWGDEGAWETVGDFTVGGSAGVSAHEMLKKLRLLNESGK